MRYAILFLTISSFILHSQCSRKSAPDDNTAVVMEDKSINGATPEEVEETVAKANEIPSDDSSGIPKEMMTSAEANYVEYCGSCHGVKMEAFVDRKWKFGNTHEDLFKAIKYGYIDEGMPAYEESFSDAEIDDLVNYIQEGLLTVDQYAFKKRMNHNGVFNTEKLQIKLDTIATGLERPWGITFLSEGNILIGDRNGKLYLYTPGGKKVEVENLPEIIEVGQGGLMDLETHPNYTENGWIYFSYTKPSPSNSEEFTTAVMRAKLELNRLIDKEEIFVALPYSSRKYHFGCRLEFDRDGYLFLTVGDRGNRDVNPQNLDNHCGKTHRIHDDGSIPKDNPFVNTEGAMPSIYTYGNRNAQGLAMNPIDGKMWEHEHGPRGGDEINIINKGINYGWPVISYGINYNGTVFTEKTHQAGMEQPVMYWLPSIGVCGMTFVNSDKYPGWENNLLSGSLRFQYLEREVIENDEVVHQEKLFMGIGRLRVVETGPDGYIYVGVEEPGHVFRLLPIESDNKKIMNRKKKIKKKM